MSNLWQIGFFGVGFYSLFSICEEPLVVSDKECLAFYWDRDQLYGRPGIVPDEAQSSWTSIFLLLREVIFLPDLDTFAHFISKSLLFTEFTEKISVSFNNELLFCLDKRRSSPSKLAISPQRLLNSLSSKPNGLFTIKNTTMQAVQIDLDKRYKSLVCYSKEGKNILSSIWSFAKTLTKDKHTLAEEEHMRSPGIFSLFLHILQCEVIVSASSSFTSATERITKKKPPASLKMLILYSSFDELEASQSNPKNSNVPHPVLNGVLPDSRDAGGGRIFIGFETHQSSGLAFHIAAPFIPTVERESLDFVDKNLAIWNAELLRIAGKLARLIYEIELQKLQKIGIGDTYSDRVFHIHRSFGIAPSTPNPLVSAVMEEELMTSTKSSIFLIPSNKGVVPINQLRTLPYGTASFAEGIPIMATSADQRFIKSILRFFNISEATFSEVMQAVAEIDLNDAQLVACLKWIITVNQTSQISFTSFYKMVSALSVPVGPSMGACRRLLSHVSHYPTMALCKDSNTLLPEWCLSPMLFNHIAAQELIPILNLQELTMIDWIKEYTKAESEIYANPEKAEILLSFVNRQYKNLSDLEKASIVSILSVVPIIPTSKGLMKPSEAFLENVSLLGEASTVVFSDRRAITDDFLIALGVKAHVEVAQIFQNLDLMNWNYRKLIKYLAQFRHQLSAEEIQLLKNAKLFPAIGLDNEKFRLDELYLDDAMTRYLRLPIMKWKDDRAPPSYSDSTDFMLSLGLNAVAPWDSLLKSVADASAKDRTKIFRYILEHVHSDYRHSFNPSIIECDYIPLKGEERRCARSSNCFTEDDLILLGFDILHPELKPHADIFHVQPRPRADLIIQKLISREYRVECLSALFSYLSRIADYFNDGQYRALNSVQFIPINELFYSPRELFFSRGKFDIGKDVFVVVDVSADARPFLRRCGVQDEPKAEHLVETLAVSSALILNEMGVGKYLELLLWISVQLDQLPRTSLDLLKNEKLLLGIDYSWGTNDGELITTKYILAAATDLFIIDDTIAQQVFKCLSVPADSALENFYRKLGSKSLFSCVKSSWRATGNAQSTASSQNLESLIQARCPLLASKHSLSTPRHDAISRITQLMILTVEKLTITREFRGQAHDQPTTACLQSKELMLITEHFDFFDIASVLARLIYAENRLSDILLIETLLSSPLSSLRAKGFPIDRLLAKNEEFQQAVNENGNTKSKVTTLPVNTQRAENTSIKDEHKFVKEDRDKSLNNIKQHHRQLHAAAPENTGRKSGLISSIRDAIKDTIASARGKEQHRRQSSYTRESLPPSNVGDEKLRSTLREGIQMLRPNEDSKVTNEQSIDVPGSVESEASSYCEIIPGHMLTFHQKIKGISIFIALSSTVDVDMNALSMFVKVLLALGHVFEISQLSTMNIFIDPSSLAIAFNRDHSLFFNFTHYQKQLVDGLADDQIVASWFITTCHELAHNFIR